MTEKSIPKISFQFEPRWLVVFIFFLVGCFIGGLAILSWMFSQGRPFQVTKVHQKSQSYQYISPLLSVENSQVNYFLQDMSLSSKLSVYYKKFLESKPSLEGQIYFRDIETGRWAGVGQDVKALTGKEAKLPLLIAYYRMNERDPTTLTKNFPIAAADGSAMTVRDALEAMILDGNPAIEKKLHEDIDPNFLKSIYTDLSLDVSDGMSQHETVSVKDYALLFNWLYNATYLSPADSEKILETLSQSDSTKGLMSGIPQGVNTSHVLSAISDRRQQDCGIVYYSNAPYILCAVTDGADMETLNQFLKGWGSLVYDHMSNLSTKSP